MKRSLVLLMFFFVSVINAQSFLDCTPTFIFKSKFRVISLNEQNNHARWSDQRLIESNSHPANEIVFEDPKDGTRYYYIFEGDSCAGILVVTENTDSKNKFVKSIENKSTSRFISEIITQFFEGQTLKWKNLGGMGGTFMYSCYPEKEKK